MAGCFACIGSLCGGEAASPVPLKSPPAATGPPPPAPAPAAVQEPQLAAPVPGTEVQLPAAAGPGAAAAKEEEPIPETEEEMRALAAKKKLAKLGGDPHKALYEAVQWGDFGIACDALEAGADATKGFGGRKNTALHLVAQMENPALLELLLRQPGLQVDVRSKDGETALHKAVKSGNKRAASLLVAARADVNAADEAKQTALALARERGRQEFVDYLVANGATE
mmetsp:Transcript_139372/g.362380  ORF Transcript_139372/g.362380 Transcript_139372/m.362380 type:complete len:225 (+) Transcript_139372:1-675(+)